MEIQEINKLLEKITNASEVSSYETSVATITRKEIEEYIDEIQTDKMGNLIAIRKDGDFRIMFSANMDEIVIMV